MLRIFRLTTPWLWLCSWALLYIAQFSHKAFAQGALTLTQPTYNCATGDIIFNSTGGNGSPITYLAPGITRSSATSSNGVVELGLRIDPKPLVITATQSGVSTTFTFNLAAACPGNFALTQPTYNCATGAITFNTIGGDGSPITYTAPGITRSGATSNSGIVEAGLRVDPKVLVITATQGGAMSVYRFDLAAFCRATPPPPPNRAPVFSGSLVAGIGFTGVPFSYTLPVGAFTDPDVGQILTYTAIGLPTGLSINAGTGAITGTSSATGVNSIVIVATDPGGLSTSGTVGVTFSPNLAPVFSGTLTSVTVIAGAPFNYTLPPGAFTDPNTGQTLTYTVTGLPIGFSANSGTGGITGTTSTTGNNTLTFTATDPGGLSTSATLGVVVVPNLAPVFSGSLATVSATVGTPLNYTLPTGSFTDPNTGQTLTYTAVGLPAGLSINTGTGGITGTPSATGTSSVTLNARDTGGLSASGVVSIVVGPNLPPVFSGTLASATGTVGSSFSYTVPAGAFTDPNTGQTLTYTAVGLPAGLSLNAGTGAVTGSLSTSGVSSVTLTATDPAGASVAGTFSIIVNGAPTPVFSGSLASVTGIVGQAFSYTLPIGTFTTGGGQTLTYAATGLPAGLTINAATGAISGTPTTAGSSTVTLRGTNTAGLSASGTLGITISASGTSGSSTVGTTPVFTGTLVSATGVVGRSFSYTLPAGSFNDPGSQTLSYSATGLPAGLTINTVTGAISGTPTTAGSSTVTIRATNPGGQSASAVVSITISASASGGGRIAAESDAVPMSIVAVSGNPINNGIIEVEVRGIAGETVQVQLTNMKGEVVNWQGREQTKDQERFRFDVSQYPSGTLLLRAVTPSRANAIRLLKLD